MLIRKVCLFLFTVLVIGFSSFHADAEADADDGFSFAPEYSETTFENFVKLYWALSKLSLENDLHVDTFLRINECEIYRDYINNELAWSEVRESGRSLIKKEIDSYPIRFNIVIPMYLSEYDQNKNIFEIMEGHEINDKSMFLIQPTNNKLPCGLNTSDLKRYGYPVEFIMMLPEKLTIREFPMSEVLASSFIRMKSSNLGNQANYIKGERLYKTRNVYLSLKVRIYSLRSAEGLGRDSDDRLYALAALEKIELFADRAQTVQLYAHDVRARQAEKTAEEIFMERWVQAQKLRDEEVRKRMEKIKANDRNDEVGAVGAEAAAAAQQ